MNQIRYINTQDLSVHPINRSLPSWSDDDERFIALCDNIESIGILVPLICDNKNRVIDGAHRLRAAKKIGLDTVPAIIQDTDDAATTIIATLLGRKHYTKSQTAFVCYPWFDEMFSENIRRRTANLKHSGAGDRVPGFRSAKELAARLGIGPRLIEQAREVHALFEEDADYAAMMQPRILDPDDPVGLGAVIAGYAGRHSTLGKPRGGCRPPEQLWFQDFSGLVYQTARIERFDELRPLVRQALAEVEDVHQLERLEATAQEILAEARRRLKAMEAE